MKPGCAPLELTLESIKARCVVEGDCWLWRQGTTGTGSPIARDQGKVVSVRRRAWELQRGVAVLSRTFVVARCLQRLCVSPMCAMCKRGADFAAFLNKNGLVNGPSHRAATAAAVRRRPLTKLTEATAGELRRRINAGEDRATVAAEFGVSYDHANRVARGGNWGQVGFSVFNQRA